MLFSSHLSSPQTSGKWFCTTWHLLSSCCSKTSSFTAGELFLHDMGFSGWKKRKKKCHNTSFTLTFKYSWICRAYSFAPSLIPFLWFYVDLNSKSFCTSMFHERFYPPSFFTGSSASASNSDSLHFISHMLDNSPAMLALWLGASLFALFSPHTWHTRRSSFTPFHLRVSVLLTCPRWLSLPCCCCVIM